MQINRPIFVSMFAVFIACLFANAMAQEVTNETWNPSEVRVLVLGTPHLQQADQATEKQIEAMKKFQLQLLDYQPDLIAVEWLHPSIDPESTDNYSRLGDAGTLAKLWGLSRKNLADSIAESNNKIGGVEESELANLRVRLGKQYYLNGDSLNAGYQWWLASQIGADTSELSRLTNDNFDGHELSVFGFETAKAQGLEMLTPFDYQGADADWNNTYGELLSEVASEATDQGAVSDDPQKSLEEFLAPMETDPESWCDEYESNEKVSPFVVIVRTQLQAQKLMQDAIETNPLGEIGYMQSEDFSELMNNLYYRDLWNLPYAGLGRQLVVNYERRNEKMAGFVVDDARAQNAKRILIVVGGGHKLFLDRIFKARGFQVQ